MAYDGPRFRRDLISTVFYEGGIRCVDVHDPKRGATFRLFDYEYSVALAFDGRDLGKVISWVRVSTGLELNEEQLTAFARRLDQLGFLEKPKVESPPPPIVPSERPAPLPVPPPSAPAPPRDETVPPPEAGSLATATRPTSGERLASTGADSNEPNAPVTGEVPGSEPLPAGEQAAQDSAIVDAWLQARGEDAIPEPIAPDHEDILEPVAAEPSEESELPGEPAPSLQDQATAAPASSADEKAGAPEAAPKEESPPEKAAPAETAPAPVEESPREEAVNAEAAPAPKEESPREETVTAEAAPKPADEKPREEPLKAEAAPKPADEKPREETVTTEAPKPTEDKPREETVTAEAPKPTENKPREETVTAEAAPNPADEKAREETVITEAAPAPSISSPELPVAVGPSPEKKHEPVQQSARMPAETKPHGTSPAPRRQVTPPPIPMGHVTPTPVPVTGLRRGPWMLSAFFGILAALVVGTVLAPFALGTRPPAPVAVMVTRVQPAQVVRWLNVTAPIEAPPLQTLSFPLGGKVLRIASPGLELRPGDVVAATDAARLALADWAHAQEQLAFAKQLLEGLRDSEDEKKIASAQVVVMQRTAQQERAHAAVSKVAITAKEPSTVDQTLVSLGQMVQAGGAAVRLRLPGWRARFDVQRVPAAQLRKQGLCLAEISGRQVPCSFLPEEGNDTHLVVGFPADAVQTPGSLTQLARSRIQNAYVLPSSALSDSNGKPRVLVVARNGRTEMRSVVLADRTTEDAVVTQGLDPEDAVIIASARPVGAGTAVRIVEDLED